MVIETRKHTDNILVRTYEDRLDLMRVLIVGPEGTPYNDAPFVFDLHLDPTKFPNEPPAVHFHSHTNSQGRCNREYEFKRWGKGG